MSSTIVPTSLSCDYLWYGFTIRLNSNSCPSLQRSFDQCHSYCFSFFYFMFPTKSEVLSILSLCFLICQLPLYETLLYLQFCANPHLYISVLIAILLPCCPLLSLYSYGIWIVLTSLYPNYLATALLTYCRPCFDLALNYSSFPCFPNIPQIVNCQLNALSPISFLNIYIEFLKLFPKIIPVLHQTIPLNRT